MTYNEWIAKLKMHLANVSEEERKKVLDYYSEAYADRIESGCSEENILVEFGAPYDAAKKILSADDDIANAPLSALEESPAPIVQPAPEAEQAAEAPKAALLPEATVAEPAPKAATQQNSSTGAAAANIGLSILKVIVTVALVMAVVCVVSAEVSLTFTGIGEIVIAIAHFEVNSSAPALCHLGLGVTCVGIALVALPWIVTGIKWLFKNIDKIFDWLKKKVKR